MRKIWKMRKVFLPQAVTLLILVISAALAPNMGMGSTALPKTESSASDGTIITTTYESGAEGGVVVKTRSTVLMPEEKSVSLKVSKPAAAEEDLDFDESVMSALAKMGLTEDHIDMWSDQHPRTTLKNLAGMSESKQRKVANVATFIRKVNKNISPKIAWREACALVYYSHKYGVPTDLSVGIAKAESRFNPSAQSKSGAMGVMQVMWKVHNGMLSKKGIATTKDHMFDPERGVEAGVMILSRYIRAYGTVQKALNRYYGGISTAYLKKVNKNMVMLEKHMGARGF